jgi:hypothetical protein
MTRSRGVAVARTGGGQAPRGGAGGRAGPARGSGEPAPPVLRADARASGAPKLGRGPAVGRWGGRGGTPMCVAADRAPRRALVAPLGSRRSGTCQMRPQQDRIGGDAGPPTRRRHRSRPGPRGVARHRRALAARPGVGRRRLTGHRAGATVRAVSGRARVVRAEAAPGGASLAVRVTAPLDRGPAPVFERDVVTLGPGCGQNAAAWPPTSASATCRSGRVIERWGPDAADRAQGPGARPS